MLLHFASVLHFAAIVITFCVSITFCGDYYILRRNNKIEIVYSLAVTTCFELKYFYKNVLKNCMAAT